LNLFQLDGIKNDILEKGEKMSEDNEKIACHVCKKMIPKAAALHAEGAEYVHHFCDTSCLAFYEEDKEKVKEKSQD
jgi:hypothetical protein